jgi:hypothetical protein
MEQPVSPVVEPAPAPAPMEIPRAVAIGTLNLLTSFVFLVLALFGCVVFLVVPGSVYPQFEMLAPGSSAFFQIVSPILNGIPFVVLFVSGYLLLKRKPAGKTWLVYGAIVSTACGILLLVTVSPAFKSILAASAGSLIVLIVTGFILYPITAALIIRPPKFLSGMDPENPRAVIIGVLNLLSGISAAGNLVITFTTPSAGISFETYPAQQILPLIYTIVSLFLFTASGYLLLKARALGKTLNLAVAGLAIFYAVLSTVLTILEGNVQTVLQSIFQPWQTVMIFLGAMLFSIVYPVLSIILLAPVKLGGKQPGEARHAVPLQDIPAQPDSLPVTPPAPAENTRPLLIAVTHITAASILFAMIFFILILLLPAGMSLAPFFDPFFLGLMIATTATGILLLLAGIKLLKSDRVGIALTRWTMVSMGINALILLVTLAKNLGNIGGAFNVALAVFILLFLIFFICMAYPVTSRWVLKDWED